MNAHRHLIAAACCLAFAHQAQAQTNDKALHAGTSAGIGLVLRNTMDSKHHAFLATLAIGGAKEAADRTKPGGRFDGRDMLANAIGAAVAVYVPKPSEVGVPVYTLHGSHNKGADAWNNKTVGVYALWDVAEIHGVEVKIQAAALRLSNDRDGFLVGVMGEYPTSWGSVFGTVSAIRGYEQVSYGNERQPGSTLECRNYCMWRTAEKKLVLAPGAGVSFDLPDRWKARVTGQFRPPGSSDPFFSNRRDTRKDYSATLWLGREF